MLITSWDVFLGRTQVTRKVILLGETPSNVGCCHGSKACWIQKGATKKIRVDFLEDLLFGDDHLGQKGCWDFRSRGVTQFVIFTSCAGGRRRERSFWWSCRRKDEHENYFSCMWAYAAMICLPDQSVLDLEKVLHDVFCRSHSSVDPLLIYCLPASLLHHHPFIQSVSPTHSGHSKHLYPLGQWSRFNHNFLVEALRNWVPTDWNGVNDWANCARQHDVTWKMLHIMAGRAWLVLGHIHACSCTKRKPSQSNHIQWTNPQIAAWF